ncbi:MAG TPA: ATP-binding cassette domain-containing protein [Thermoanaerobaculia bacterium]|nr:ATP-binding cassette domain-containing protein [Thermoanaerobaculia bacterium]
MRLSRISKSFGTVHAVDDVSLDINAGEILAVIGENGAGKTTLMRIAAGELTADSGTIDRVERVELVHQHFMLVPELTIAENLALTERRRMRFATRRTLEREAAETIRATGIALPDVARRVGDLSVGEKAKLELIKAIAKQPSTLILDEPTSVLTPHETEELFRVMRRLAADGKAVVFISHKLPEVLSIAGRIVVMRGGRVVLETRDARAEVLAQAMVVSRETPARNVVRSGGRITAIVGVAGNGQTELAATLRDDDPGAGHIPEDRTRDGLIAEMSIAENLALRANRWRPREAARHAEEMIRTYSIRAHSPRQRAGELSGGNQQKVILARELDRRPRTIVAAEPTRGLDVEATRFVHEQLRSAAANGASIVLITSDLDEAFALADDVQVIYRGTLSEPMPPEIAASRVAGLMAGLRS